MWVVWVTKYFSLPYINLVASKKKKENLTSCSSDEAEYYNMVDIICEMMWIQTLGFFICTHMCIYLDSQVPIFIKIIAYSINLMHIEMDCHHIYDNFHE